MLVEVKVQTLKMKSSSCSWNHNLINKVELAQVGNIKYSLIQEKYLHS